MCDVLHHRGPDGAGTQCAAGVGLGHRRLAIIDVAGGAQPLANEDGAIWTTFNGEIYNYQDLRRQLLDRGHVFSTSSDTEVLVHAYESFGDCFVSNLNGMFAFALHDRRRGRVLLARDHLGIKPLFYAIRGGTLFFASEIKAVLVATGELGRLRTDSLQEYLVFRYVTGERTFFEGVNRLPPAHIAIWEGGKLSVRPYWTLPSASSRPLEFGQAARELGTLLTASVSAQMMSEVPLGAFCSGGVDSGIVSALAAEASPHQLETFAVGFSDPEWDERALAADTAGRIRSRHHTVVAEPGEFLALLPGLVWHHDEPLSHPNAIPLYQLSRFARGRVTVVLTGEGADELFCGYPRYHIARWGGAVEGLPPAWRRAIGAATRRVPGHRAAKLAGLVGLELAEALVLNSAYVSPELVAALTGASAAAALEPRRRLLAQARVPGDAVASLSRYELLTYLVCALDRMDRMSMACSLEGRVPFLDVPLVEWGLAVSTGAKLGWRQTKRVVKALASSTLSPEVTYRSKSGFGVPLGDWFRSPVLSPLLDRLRDRRHPAAAHFDPEVLGTIVREHASGAHDHGEILWLLANVYIWHEVRGWGTSGLPIHPGFSDGDRGPEVTG